MKPVLKVVIAEPSLIIRKGLLTVLKKLSTLNIEAAEVADMQQLPALLSWRRPDILIIYRLLYNLRRALKVSH